MKRSVLVKSALILTLTCSCGSNDEELPRFEGCGSDSTSLAATTEFAQPVPVEGSECNARITEEALSEGIHVDECESIQYTSNPPSSGRHYRTWAAFDVYDEPVPRGFWVHSLEHGAVVIAHNCRNCGAAIERAKALIDTLPEDVTCTGTGALRRVILTPDPLLDVPWAAAAWGFTLRSSCFEEEVFRAFATDYYRQGPEDLCNEGRSF